MEIKNNSEKLEENIEKGKKYVKIIAFFGVAIFSIYSLLATFNIIPRFSGMYQVRRQPFFYIFQPIDPLQNFNGWFILSLICLTFLGIILYFFNKKKKLVEDAKRKFVFELSSSIVLYVIVFQSINLLIISLIKLLGII